MQNIREQFKPILESPLFSAFADSELIKLENCFKKVKLKPNETLFKEGDQASHFYYVVSGEVQLFKTSTLGTEKVIEILCAGDYFAEATVFFDPQVYPVSAQTLSKCELISADSQVFLQLIGNSSEVCFRMLRALSVRLHNKVQEINHLSMENSTFRLVHYLLTQYDECRKCEEEDDSLCLLAPKKIIASRLSIKPETFSRILASLKKKGLIEVEKQNIILKDIQGLKNYI